MVRAAIDVPLLQYIAGYRRPYIEGQLIVLHPEVPRYDVIPRLFRMRYKRQGDDAIPLDVLTGHSWGPARLSSSSSGFSIRVIATSRNSFE